MEQDLFRAHIREDGSCIFLGMGQPLQRLRPGLGGPTNWGSWHETRHLTRPVRLRVAPLVAVRERAAPPDKRPTTDREATTSAIVHAFIDVSQHRGTARRVGADPVFNRGALPRRPRMWPPVAVDPTRRKAARGSGPG